jgi:chromosome segregation ATPase
METATAGTSELPSVDEQAQLLAAHMTARETATLQAQLDATTAQLEAATAERDALATQVDTLTVERDAAVTEFATFRSGLEEAARLETVTAERTEALRAVAPQLLEGEKATARVERLVAMEQASFEDYLETLREVAVKVEGAPGTGTFSEEKAESATAVARGTNSNTPDGKSLARTTVGL